MAGSQGLVVKAVKQSVIGNGSQVPLPINYTTVELWGTLRYFF